VVNPVAVITGASSGIGLAAATELARRGWAVALVGRDPGRLDSALSVVRLAATGPEPVAHRSNFASLSEVRRLAADLAGAYEKIDLLANNAGGAFAKRKSTSDGHELTMQVNHLSPFLLANLLRDRLAGGRLVATASAAHRGGRLDPADLASANRRYRTLAVYGSAKQANILFAAEAARRWPDVLTASYHPGVVRTRFGGDNPVVAAFFRYYPGLRTPEQGAATMVWLATADPAELTSGAYYVDNRIVVPSPRLVNDDLAERLWKASAHAVALPT
jgi:NAD(P)-dependent dehydrogenase (short-subunit alcohol dehydrogenase family)